MRVTCLLTGSVDYAIAIAEALAPFHDVELIAPADLVARHAGDVDPRLRLVPIPWPRHRSLANLALLARLRVHLARRRPQVLHFVGDSVVWLVLALPFLRRYPLVVTVHDVDYHPGDVQSRRVPMRLVQRLRRSATALIVHGEGLRRDLASRGLAPPAGIHVVHHLVLMRYVRLARAQGMSSASGDGTYRVLFFGRVMAYKGLAVLIAAADLVVEDRPHVRFVVAGTGPELDRLRPELERRPWFDVRDRFVPDDEVSQLFVDADIIALPYLEASQSGVAALAASFGRPVVATRTGELGELVAATGMGQVVAPGDATAFAAAILAVLDDPSYARAAVAAAAGPLAPSRIAQAVSKVYAAALADHAAGPGR